MPDDNVIPFSPPTPKQKNKGKTLCRSGFHKGVVDKSTPFDSKQGKLVTRNHCVRCGKIKINNNPS